jgi:rare lipoprotein A
MTISRQAGAAFCLVTFLTIEGCAGSAPRFTSKNSGSPSATSSHQLQGIASYYADEFNGRTTSNGEVFDMHKLTAAHRTLPFGTVVRVTNTQNGRSVVVRINDRGPFKDDRVIDLSLEGARQIGMIANGTAPVTLEIVDFGPSR